jgi:hypothetical protein
VPPVMSAASISLLVVGAGRSTLMRPGSEAAMVPTEGCGVSSRGGSAVRSVIPGAGPWISGAGTRVPEAGAVAVVLGAECRHLAREVLDLLQNCGVVGRWTNDSECRLGCDLGDAVRAVGCGFQAALLLTGENGLYVRG